MVRRALAGRANGGWYLMSPVVESVSTNVVDFMVVAFLSSISLIFIGSLIMWAVEKYVRNR